MHFAYQGFTHDHDIRRFRFRGIQELIPPIDFSVEIDLALLFRTRVPVTGRPGVLSSPSHYSRVGRAKFLR